MKILYLLMFTCLVLPPRWCSPIQEDPPGLDQAQDVPAGVHVHADPPRGGRDFTNNVIDLGNTLVSGHVHGGDVSIGSSVGIQVGGGDVSNRNSSETNSHPGSFVNPRNPPGSLSSQTTWTFPDRDLARRPGLEIPSLGGKWDRGVKRCEQPREDQQSLHDFISEDLEKLKNVSLSSYRGKVTLLLNVAGF